MEPERHELMPTDAPLSQAQVEAAFVGGMPKLTSKLQVVDYNPEWPQWYEREAARLRALLGERVRALDHVGSTSVPGLAAKPTIDVDLTLDDSADEAAYVPVLEAAGYRLTIREPEWHEHRLFKGPDTDINLHVWTVGSPEAQRHLIFRDWLRANETDRGAYGEHKKAVAEREYEYAFQYNNGKAALLREILARALAASV
ncbi:GrpB family protein [Deinococcus hopiensis]|uniref:GrpB domain, predicted nucleotidyltransferase, UPF0157 family n=1 Tax=Deinococcus hopiensis KR-140 TaxID=695939 RepID=A0A1W1VV38_9DEIO|nr:GrpB family protein [Deinococcus hopiensis]SMB97252.1 GrpB domain, predicted nucleotidyltransferase, UPF0157 family [Deinococcus hopiensis KR-140]